MQFEYFTNHSYLDMGNIPYLMDESKFAVPIFEKMFGGYVGSGKCKSYATARMGFYSILKWLNQKGDILIPKQTCKVMSIYIKGAGYNPILYDLSDKTLGSDIENIKKNITSNSKVIVAQHSFGIPCDIIPIQKYCKKHNIFLIEDCALTFDSKIHNIPVGNFSDAAIFSLDHGKPINGMMGGIVYTKNIELFKSLYNEIIPCVTSTQQKMLFKQMLFENKKRNFFWYLIMKLRWFFRITGFYDENKFILPTQMINFCAKLGISELLKWNDTRANRIKAIEKESNRLEIYNSKVLDIVPFLYIFSKDNKKNINIMNKFFGLK